jgi:RNA polymerase sigma factor (TIGR02999 family)
VDAVYDDLRKIAAGRMSDRMDRPLAGLTLQPTAIASDAVMELRRQRVRWQNSDQFFAIAARLIGHLVSDYRKQRGAQKRGGGNRGVPIDQLADDAIPAAHLEELSPMLRLLERMHEEHPRKAEVLSLHVICGHSLAEIAKMLDLSPTQIRRDWSFARRWMKLAMQE